MGTNYTVDPLAGIPTATAINDNLNNIQDALERALSRYGDGTNTVQSDLDANGYHVYNLPEPVQDSEPVRLIDLTDGISILQDLADQAADSAAAAASSASDAADSAAAALDAATVDIITTTISYSVVAADTGDMVVCNNTADINITLPVGMPDGMHIIILRNNTGRVNLLTSGSFIIASPFTSELRTTDSVVDCVCVDGVNGSWVVSGDLLDTLP